MYCCAGLVGRGVLLLRSLGGRNVRGMTSIDEAPDPDSPEFLQNQNPVEKVSPDTDADAPATDATLIPTDPSLSHTERL